jgi:osmoprotectant transport system ATP-binding protein
VLVSFHDVGFVRAGRPPVLRGLNFTIESGETIALVGRSGAGKTTLLKLINRLLLPTSGRVVVEGRDTRDWDGIRLRRRIGYAFQDVGLFPHMNVEENITVVPRLEGWAPERAKARATELLDLIGLPAAQFAARWPHELSGGQRQRIGLARALAIDPQILLMDEPFGALDPVTRMEVRAEFMRIQSDLKTTAVLVTHDMAEAFTLGKRVGVIEAGELIALDTPEAIGRSVDARIQPFLTPMS